MIRRNHTEPDGSRRWILISQVDHAQISGKLASNWGADGFARVGPREELLPAIFGHDDGWSDWERHPGIDPQLGRPLNFTEMPLAESLDIWQRSVDMAARHGLLAGHVVSGHFSALLRHSNHWQKMGGNQAVQAAEFLARHDSFRAQALALWQAANSRQDAPAVFTEGLRFLQFFDALSLWFCMAQRDRPQTLDVPRGPPLTLSPVRSDEISISPWPLGEPELTLAIPGRSIPVGHYASPQALAAAGSTPVELCWRLTPAK